jgi:low temperature requirement protein LtrA
VTWRLRAAFIDGTLGGVTQSTTEPSGHRGAVRVSTLELFFDLVFVFTLTRLTAVLADDLTPVGVTRVLLLVSLIMWMYGGYAWLTNTVTPVTRFHRTLVLVGMAGFLGIALSIPDAFGSAGWLFGVGYFVVNAVHSGLFIVAGGPGAIGAMRRLAPFNLTSATLILVGGFLPLAGRYALWTLAFLVMVVSPYLNPINRFTLSPAHFVERHGLLIIIALGESVVAIGVGATGQVLDLGLVAVAVLGLSLSYLMWWVYFGGGEEEAEHAFTAVPDAARGRVAIHAFGWAHFGLLFGVVAVAAGIKKAVSHPVGHLKLSEALVLAGGLAVYLISDVAFRRFLRMGQVGYRAAAAVVVFATVPLGLTLGGGVQLAALIMVVLVMLAVEARRPVGLVTQRVVGGVSHNP